MQRMTPLVVMSMMVAACGGAEESAETPFDPPACWTAPEGQPGFGTRNDATFEEMRAVAGTADDGPFHMVNLIAYREKACYVDGRESDLTGEEADELYAPLEFLTAIGAEVRFVAADPTAILGDGAVWDRLAIVRYPSREDFFRMVDDPAFQARSEHKNAGVARSIVMVSDLMPSTLPADFVPKDAPGGAGVPHPATADDPALEIVHVLKLRDQAVYPPGSDEPPRTGKEAIALYQEAALSAAMTHGVYPVAWFEIRGVLIGDGRQWDEFRINHFPSGEAFSAVVADPIRAAGSVHRDAAIDDTYTFMSHPLLNELDPFR